MESLTALMGGFAIAFTPTNLALAFMGCIVGTAIGVLPGIGSSPKPSTTRCSTFWAGSSMGLISTPIPRHGVIEV